MNLYLVHCGYYEDIFEFHMNFFKVAQSESDAKEQVKNEDIYKLKKMHVDGIKILEKINGFKIQLIKED
jgi:hypothetical protein